MTKRTSEIKQHGTTTAARLGCRCDDCSAARLQSARHLRDNPHIMVPTRLPRQHVEWLLERGATPPSVSRAACVPLWTIERMLYSTSDRAASSTMLRVYAEPLMEVTPAQAYATVPADWARELTSFLDDRGWTRTAIGKAINLPGGRWKLYAGTSRVIRSRYEALRQLAEAHDGAEEVTAAHDAYLTEPSPVIGEWRLAALGYADDIKRAKLYRSACHGTYIGRGLGERKYRAKAERMRRALNRADPVAQPVEASSAPPELWRERRAELEALYAELTDIMLWRAENRSWLDRAACRDYPPEMFFPPRGSVQASHQGRQVCAACPVREQCLEHCPPALNDVSILGGMSGRQRRDHFAGLRAEGAGLANTA